MRAELSTHRVIIVECLRGTGKGNGDAERRRMAIQVRSFRQTDLEAVARIINAAYRTPLSPATRATIGSAPQDILVAEYDGVPAGVVILADYVCTGYVGSMAVDPALRRRGIGRGLMRELLARCERAGITGLFLDATESGAPLYEEFGFQQTDVTNIFERDGTAAVRPNGRTRPAPETIDAALALDREIAGWTRERALRALLTAGDAELLSAPDGYAFVRGFVIGPWVAACAATAECLLTHCIEREPGPLRAFVPGCNRSAIEMLGRYGFACMRSLRHMTRGAPAPRRENIYGQASLAHG